MSGTSSGPRLAIMTLKWSTCEVTVMIWNMSKFGTCGANMMIWNLPELSTCQVIMKNRNLFTLVTMSLK